MTTVDVQNARVRNVHLDFDLSIGFDDGSAVAFSQLDFGGTSFDEDNQFEGLRALTSLLTAQCTVSELAADGTLTLRFDDGTAVTAAPREEVESWEYTAPDGATVLCLPGGIIETLDAPETSAAPASPTGSPAIGSTVVRVSSGEHGGIQFSDGTVLATNVDLESAYLILRESVVRVGRGIELSSGHVL
ncbi:DUF6188 family protein [Rhodococcus sp. NPDC057297]|uniref:DUF6188 family protein n=1 Tax=Rhodococcus sp. NPDC057297 TaxID=3346090 RepID=UPI0036447534